jgi:hypothetical protein
MVHLEGENAHNGLLELDRTGGTGPPHLDGTPTGILCQLGHNLWVLTGTVSLNAYPYMCP